MSMKVILGRVTLVSAQDCCLLNDLDTHALDSDRGSAAVMDNILEGASLDGLG
jgi:hypothetical protein